MCKCLTDTDIGTIVSGQVESINVGSLLLETAERCTGNLVPLKINIKALLGLLNIYSMSDTLLK